MPFKCPEIKSSSAVYHSISGIENTPVNPRAGDTKMDKGAVPPQEPHSSDGSHPTGDEGLHERQSPLHTSAPYPAGLE